MPIPLTDPLVVFKNLPHHNQTGSHAQGAPLEHAYGHAALFGERKPKFRTAEAYNWTTVKSVTAAGYGVDPVICSQGGGCDPNDVGCNNCDPTDPTCGEG